MAEVKINLISSSCYRGCISKDMQSKITLYQLPDYLQRIEEDDDSCKSRGKSDKGLSVFIVVSPLLEDLLDIVE